MRKLGWLGNSKKELKKFPREVQAEVGYALYVAQYGEKHENTKPLTGLGTGIYEIVTDYNKDTYRSVYVVNIKERLYVIHCFQKKAKKGIKTPKEEIRVIKDRLKALRHELDKR